MKRTRDEIEDEEEEDDYSIKDIKREILRQMKGMDKTSKEFLVLSQRLTEITECERNQTQTEQTIAQKWSWIVPTIVQSVSTAVNTTVSYAMNRKTVNDVLNFEDRGNILTTKSQTYIKKP